MQVFTTLEGGIHKPRELIKRFGLCASLCRLSSCELYSLIDKKNELLCTARQPSEIYNEKVAQALSYLKADVPGFYIIDKGRNACEKSCIWVENGNFYCMGYISNDADAHLLEYVKDSLTQYQGNHYIMHLLISFTCRHPKNVYQYKKNNI
ncbi:MAG: hypothetical protein PW786_12705 [Arachidicoccus sp.]|nr:hypothetical protein [Arachidicoccus sp.]